MRRGTTVPELIVVLTVVGILLLIALTRTGALRDRASVRAAATETHEGLQSIAVQRHHAGFRDREYGRNQQQNAQCGVLRR